MSLFDGEEFDVCQKCGGGGWIWDESLDAHRQCSCQSADPTTGKYSGSEPTGTEKDSGDNIERERRGPMKRGGAEHVVLQVYGDGRRRTSYDASFEAVGDFHAKRRESTRLLERGFLQKDGTLPNRALAGRPHVDAYRLTATGRDALNAS
jgi:hypothetical protein